MKHMHTYTRILDCHKVNKLKPHRSYPEPAPEPLAHQANFRSSDRSSYVKSTWSKPIAPSRHKGPVSPGIAITTVDASRQSTQVLRAFLSLPTSQRSCPAQLDLQTALSPLPLSRYKQTIRRVHVHMPPHRAQSPSSFLARNVACFRIKLPDYLFQYLLRSLKVRTLDLHT
jgi:hypothetical protein